MPTTIRIMNWNIQTFGVMKAGIKHNNLDVLAAIARIVNDTGCDIFVMLEMNTTREDVAVRLAADMLDELYFTSPGANEWDLAVLSPNTGREFYAFFIRDRTLTVPLPLTNPLNPATGQPVRVLNHVDRVQNAIFTAPAAADDGVLLNWFPLIEPDVARTGYAMRNPYPVWPGVRRPVLGMFYLPQAAPANAILPIVACHYVPDPNIARQQFETLPYFSILRGLAPNAVAFGQPVPAPVPTTVNTGTGNRNHALNYYFLTGDFNVHYQFLSPDYASITGAGLNQLAAAPQIFQNTHLMTYGQIPVRRPHNTQELAVSDYDNFFSKLAPAAPVPAQILNPNVINVPELIRTRAIGLNESVQYYAELDKRGFDGSHPYLDVVQDYARQITGDRSQMINITGSLMGGRLISDHLPSLIDVTVN